GHQADPAASQRSCFHRDKTPEALFIQNRRHLPITFACIARMRGPNHSATLRRLIPPRESPEQNLSDPLQLRLTYLWTGPKGHSRHFRSVRRVSAFTPTGGGRADIRQLLLGANSVHRSKFRSIRLPRQQANLREVVSRHSISLWWLLPATPRPV